MASLLLLGVFYFVSAVPSHSAQLLRFCFSHCWDRCNMFFSIWYKEHHSGGASHKCLHRSRNAWYTNWESGIKKHIFYLKQMKLTLCHVYRALYNEVWVSAAVSWNHCCGILLWIFLNQRMGHIICCTASFADVFKTKTEGDVYHFLTLYLKEDFWSALLNFSAGMYS